MRVQTVGIFGVGAIGGSIGLRARRGGAHVVGADCDRAALEDAHRLGAIDEIATPQSLPHIVEVMVIAAPLDATLLELERLAATPLPAPMLVIDVASVKVPVVRAARGLPNFVPTHPLAGTERSGVAAARADLFKGCAWAYVPTGDEELDARGRRFIESLDGIAVGVTAPEHDRAVAMTSHLPQIIAWCFARQLRDSAPDAREFCGPVARELLRISTMRSALWRDVLQANAENVGPQLRRLAAQLEAAADALQFATADGLAPLVEQVPST